MSNEIDLTNANTVVIPLTGRGGISEETMKIMAEAQSKLCDKLCQDMKDGKTEVIVMHPKASLLPELEYIGDGKYRFKKDSPSS